MRIKIDLKIFVFIIIFLITRQIKIYGLLMLFAFIHECAHLIAGLFVGLKPEFIKILPYGFAISFKTKCEDYNKKIKKGNLLSVKKIIIAIAGPFINLFLAILIYVLNDRGILIGNFENIIYANILLFLFNMIPIYPLDGGRIFKELIYIHKGLKESYYQTNIISKISIIILTALSSFILLFYKNIAIIFVIGYLWILVIKNDKQTKIINYIYGLVKS